MSAQGKSSVSRTAAAHARIASVEAPVCGKCARPIVTGMTVFYCHRREACELYNPPDEETAAFIRRHWEARDELRK